MQSNQENNAHFQNLLQAIHEERKQEESFFRSLAANKSLSSKIEGGFTWYPVRLIKTNWTVGEYLEVTLERIQLLGPHKFTEGVAVRLFHAQPDVEEIRGVISAVRGDKMRIFVPGHLQERLEAFQRGNAGVELIYDDRPYKVMERAVASAMETKRSTHLAIKSALITGNTRMLQYELHPESHPPDQINPAIFQGLNASQQQAIVQCLTAPALGIIHGPPGTGKTTTLIGLAKALLKEEKRLLVCAPSNTATDLLTEKLLSAGIRTLRLGNLTRIHDNLMPHTLEESVRSHADWNHIKKVRIEAAETERRAEQYKRHFGQEEWEMRRSLKKEARELRKWAGALEQMLMEKILLEAQAITCTLIGVSHSMLENVGFETVLIDEASQATEAECWNAILKGRRTILAGDHKQLPPTVKSKEAVRLGMEITLLDNLADRIPHCSLLQVQYRMHDAILGFSNHRFYKGLLSSHPDNAGHLVRNDSHPLVFIDTAGCGFEEEWQAERQSCANPGEFFILREHILLHRENYLGASIGILSPYAEQVRHIRDQISDDDTFSGMDIEVNTIDGFQGQEKDIVYLSLVRSNEKGEIGFLKDERRLNVALTRARKKMIVIGDSATLAQHGLFSDFIEYNELHGLYDSAWNYMS